VAERRSGPGSDSVPDPVEAFRTLARTLSGEPDVVEPGFRSQRQWAELLGISVQTIRLTMRNGIEQGLVERKVFKLIDAAGRLLPVPHYRIKESK